MGKFWDWMEEYKYGKKLGDKKVIFFKDNVYGKTPTNQMIIGYMIEYLFDTGNAHVLDFIPTSMNDFNIDNYYAWLKDFVEVI